MAWTLSYMKYITTYEWSRVSSLFKLHIHEPQPISYPTRNEETIIEVQARNVKNRKIFLVRLAGTCASDRTRSTSRYTRVHIQALIQTGVYQAISTESKKALLLLAQSSLLTDGLCEVHLPPNSQALSCEWPQPQHPGWLASHTL